jgi:hypothetical protein
VSASITRASSGAVAVHHCSSVMPLSRCTARTSWVAGAEQRTKSRRNVSAASVSTSSSPAVASADNSCSYFDISPGPSGGRLVETAAAHGWASNSSRLSRATVASRSRHPVLTHSARGISP